MKIGIDMSYYDIISQAEWDILARVINGVTVRMWFGADNLDSSASKHVAECQKRHIPYNGYGWVDITENLDAQVARYQQAVSLFHPFSMMNDYEQYWTDWNAYMKQDLVKVALSAMPSDKINAFNLAFQNKVMAVSTVPVGQYSGDWFIDKWCPQMRTWVTQRNYWEARYMRYYDSTYLADKRKEWGIPFDVNHVLELAQHAYIYKGIGRQFESYLEIQGLTHDNWHLDWSVWSDEGFSRMFGTPYIPDPDEPLPQVEIVYTVTAFSAWIRETPNGLKIGYKWKGDQVIGIEVVNGWVHLLTGGWMGLTVLTPVGNTFRVTEDLNIRSSPNGSLLTPPQYLYTGNIVKVSQVINGWGMIGTNRWCSMKYLVPIL